MKWFATSEDYTMDQTCPICKAPPWIDCNAPGKQKTGRDRMSKQHVARQDRGSQHYKKDRANAPENKVLGENYSTIKHKPVVIVTNGEK